MINIPATSNVEWIQSVGQDPRNHSLTFTFLAHGRGIACRVTEEALLMLADGSVNLSPELIEEHRARIQEIVELMVSQKRVQNGEVVVDAVDVQANQLARQPVS